MAVGAALAGYRPVVELYMAEFMLVAMDQVVNEAPRLRYMTGGQIEEYLRALEQACACGPERAAAILAEAEDHLREAVADGLAAGLTEAQAARAAIGSFGSVPDVVRAYQTQPRRAAALLTRQPGTGCSTACMPGGCAGSWRAARRPGTSPSSWTATGAGPGSAGWPTRASATSTARTMPRRCSAGAGGRHGHVTVFACSAENLTGRDRAEVDYLMGVIEQIVADKLTVRPTWQVHIAGHLDMLPDSTARALKNAVEVSRDCATGAHLTLAVGYGGRQEVIDAFRSVLYEHAEAGTTLAELADTITMEDIARHLHTAGQPDPDLVIRTSGDCALSNFLLWQSAYSELYFCDTYWPAFREIDFLRALRSFAARQRRYGQ